MNRPIQSPASGRALSETSAAAERPGTIYPSLSRTNATYTSDPYMTQDSVGIRLLINVSDKGASGTLTVKVQTEDPATGNYLDLPGATTSALASNALTSLTICPSIAETANETISDHIGHKFRIVATVGVNAVVFSIGCVLLKG